jgi:hypothetical protein
MTMHDRIQENSRNNNDQLGKLLFLEKEFWKWA